jgi:aspartyl-tRNA(Asn)/glutamyl-tRNA(Gln) amidotransferase subunit A
MSKASEESDIAFAPLTVVSQKMKAGEITSVALTRLMLDRIERLNPILNCYITVCREHALEQAEGHDRLLSAGVDLGPLHGVPVAIKDNIATRGVRTTGGSRILKDWVPEADAPVVGRTKRAGGVILGKLALYEFAYGGWHDDYGPETRNPWDLSRSCSASSNGPACAVAGGLAYASLGTDTGGSVRLPAAACGLVGMKPTYGLVSRAGVLAGGYSLDHVGPFGRTVADVAAYLQVIAGPDDQDPAGTRRPARNYSSDLERGIKGTRIGVPLTQPNELIDPEMRAAFEAALEVLKQQGAQIVEIDVPNHLLSRTCMWAISASELAEAHRKWLKTRAEDYSPTVRALIRQGAFLPATEYVRAQRVRQKIILGYAEAMKQVELIAMPVVPFPCWTIGSEEIAIGDARENLMACLTRYCPPFNITGMPAIAVPNGFSSDGRPLGFQIAGRLFDDATVLRAARAYERVTDWHTRRPPVE